RKTSRLVPAVARQRGASLATGSQQRSQRAVQPQRLFYRDRWRPSKAGTYVLIPRPQHRSVRPRWNAAGLNPLGPVPELVRPVNVNVNVNVPEKVEEGAVHGGQSVLGANPGLGLISSRHGAKSRP